MFTAVPLFEDKEATLGLGSFSAFVICALNDQSVPGRGQTSILKGAHLVAEKFFQWQRDVVRPQVSLRCLCLLSAEAVACDCLVLLHFERLLG